jgi:hypothetical protein
MKDAAISSGYRTTLVFLSESDEPSLRDRLAKLGWDLLLVVLSTLCSFSHPLLPQLLLTNQRHHLPYPIAYQCHYTRPINPRRHRALMALS